MCERNVRAWDGKRMVVPEIINRRCHTCSCYVLNNPEWESSYRFDQLIFMLGTGVNDEYGTEIFEGDIVETESGERMKIVFDNERLAFLCEKYSDFGAIALENVRFRGNWKATKNLADYLEKGEVLTVIGNIHENPEKI